jgi:signal recognition particle receptor subunit beta/GAF domain-containing protein
MPRHQGPARGDEHRRPHDRAGRCYPRAPVPARRRRYTGARREPALEIQHHLRVVRVKIVYYGPAVGGKTTNLQVLHDAAVADHRGDLVSVNSTQDRTILFDLLPLKGVGFQGFEIRFQIVAVPGQPAYAATRRISLRGADAIVFVANSAVDRFHENSLSFKELAENLVSDNEDPAQIPLVLQYNKRDLPKTTPIQDLERALNFRRAPYVEAVASRGEGVLETLGAIVEQAMVELSARYRTLSLPPGETAQAWTRETLGRVFGGRKTLGSALASTPNREPAATLAAPAASLPGRHLIRVALAGEAGGGAAPRPDARPEDALIDSYARASVALGQSLDEVREQRDEARRWLGDVELAFGTVEALASGGVVTEALKPLLARILTTAGSRRASLLVPGAGGAPRRLAGAALSEDPLLASPAGQRLLARELSPFDDPRLLAAAENDDLREAVAGVEPAITFLLTLPLRSGPRLHGVVLVYFGSTDPLPAEEVITHLERLARALASGFMLSRLRSEAAKTQRALAASIQGEVARRALPELQRVLEVGGQQLVSLTPRAGADGPGLDQARQAVESALGLARTVRNLDEQPVASTPVAMDTLLGGLTTPGVRSETAPGLRAAGDPALLRIAVDALTELAAAERTHPGPLVSAGLDEGRVRIVVEAGAASAPVPASDPRLALVRHLATLHGGSVRVSVSSGRPLYALFLPRA